MQSDDNDDAEVINHERDECVSMVAAALVFLSLLNEYHFRGDPVGHLPCSHMVYPEDFPAAIFGDLLKDKRIKVTLELQNRHEPTD